jgi:hypothetical protein
MDNTTYEVNGTERKEVTREKVDCGDCVKTSYYHPESGELLRRDVEILVSKEFMNKFRVTLQTRR